MLEFAFYQRAGKKYLLLVRAQRAGKAKMGGANRYFIILFSYKVFQSPFFLPQKSEFFGYTFHNDALHAPK
jgi:hypothetical protein